MPPRTLSGKCSRRGADGCREPGQDPRSASHHGFSQKLERRLWARSYEEPKGCCGSKCVRRATQSTASNFRDAAKFGGINREMRIPNICKSLTDQHAFCESARKCMGSVGRRRDEMIAISGSLALLTNVIRWNTHRMQTTVDAWRRKGQQVDDDWLHRMGPAGARFAIRWHEWACN